MDTFDTFDNFASDHSMHDGHHGLKTGFNNRSEFVIKTPNQVGGHDTFVNGKHITHTENNVMGGQNVYHGSHLAEVSVPNVENGIDLYNGDMQYKGSLFDNGIGGEHYLSQIGNAHSIMNYHDPLSHAHEYKMNPFDMRGGQHK